MDRKEELTKKFAQRLISARLSAGLSYDELAAKAGLPKEIVSRVEENPFNVPINILKHHMTALGLEESFFAIYSPPMLKRFLEDENSND